MITQNEVNTFAKVIKWGCLGPIAAGILLLLISYIYERNSNNGFVPELGLHYMIDYDSYTTEDDRRIHQARLYFSRTDTFGTDYIHFNYSECASPRIYYVEPDTFYVKERYSYDNLIQDIQSKQFNIVYIDNANSDDKKKEHEDSVLRAKSYSFQLYNFANIITVFDPQGKIIYEKDSKLF